jgi:ribonuclease HII
MGVTDSFTPDFSFERAALERGLLPVCGIDEAGRGPWAGPVVAAAVILDPDNIPEGIDDSKRLTAEQREDLFAAIDQSAAFGIGIASVTRIDRDNILAATLWAMCQAVRMLPIRPALALIDGNRAPRLACSGETIVAGDQRSLSIAAASIVAKVTRDRIMTALDHQFPGYNFARHKGYGTDGHQEALARLGPSPQHRRSFAPVREVFSRII